MTRGRPPNLSAWRDILTRLQSRGVAKGGPYTPGQLRHYLRELTRRGLIEPARYFSHLPTDGPGAKRYVLTRRGKATLKELEAGVAVNRGPTAERELKPPRSKASARATTRSAPRYSQRYVGGHNLCFRMVVEQPFERPFVWASEHAMGPKEAPRWMSRHKDYEPGVHIEEAGGTIRDPAGAAGHVILLKFAVPSNGRSPIEVEREAESRAQGIRRTIEMLYGCQLSEPEIRGHPKHSFPRDPFAKVIRSRGVALHGKIGVDDTPEEGTLEIEEAAKAEAYLNLPDTLIQLTAALNALRTEVAKATKVNATTFKALADAQTHVVREVAELKKRGPVTEARPETRNPAGVHPDEAREGGFG